MYHSADGSKTWSDISKDILRSSSQIISSDFDGKNLIVEILDQMPSGESTNRLELTRNFGKSWTPVTAPFEAEEQKESSGWASMFGGGGMNLNPFFVGEKLATTTKTKFWQTKNDYSNWTELELPSCSNNSSQNSLSQLANLFSGALGNAAKERNYVEIMGGIAYASDCAVWVKTKLNTNWRKANFGAFHNKKTSISGIGNHILSTHENVILGLDLSEYK
jgi:hypothetical protein